MVPLLCLSPVNGAVYVEREVLSSEQAGVAIVIVRHAQWIWAARPASVRASRRKRCS